MRKIALLAVFIMIIGFSDSADAFYLGTAYISDSIPIPTIAPEGLTWDGYNLWVSDLNTETFAQISPATKTIIKTIPGFYSAEGLTWDGNYLWTFDLNDKTLKQIDPDTGGSIYSVNVGTANRGGLTYDGSYFWKVDRPDFIRIDPSDGSIIETISEFDIAGIEEGLACDGRYLYNVAYTSASTPKIHRIDPPTHTLLENFSLPEGTYNGLTYDGQSLWAANYDHNVIYKVSPIPEPSSLLLLGFGLFGIGLSKRRKAKRKPTTFLNIS